MSTKRGTQQMNERNIQTQDSTLKTLIEEKRAGWGIKKNK